jgi:uncharacterized Zn-binding protein involved in type VI secretion
MQLVARLNDAESHACRIIQVPQDWVTIDGRLVATVDSIVCCALPGPPHPTNGKVTAGSSVWYIDGKPVARLHDPTQHFGCGGGQITGSCSWVWAD